MSWLYIADIAPQYIFLTKALCAELQSPVTIVIAHNGSASVMTQFWGIDRLPFQIATEVIDVLPDVSGLFGKVAFPGPLELLINKLAPYTAVPNMLIACGR